MLKIKDGLSVIMEMLGVRVTAERWGGTHA